MRRLTCCCLSAVAVAALALAACAGKKNAPQAKAAPAADAAPAPDAEPPPVVKPGPALAPVEGASADAGKKLFAQKCASCHGEDGKGQPAAAGALPPTNLGRTFYMCRTTDGRPVPIPSDADIESALDRGSHKAAPGLAALDAAARRSLTLYVKSLAKDFTGDPQPLAHIEPETPDDDASRARGRTLYLAFGCWRCHGLKGKGDGPAATSLFWNGQKYPRVAPLADESKYLCGGDPEATYRVIALGVVGAEEVLMPRYQEFTENYPRPKEGTPETWTHALEGQATPAEIEAIRTFLAEQPIADDVLKMKPSEKRARSRVFMWDLVHYVRSL